LEGRVRLRASLIVCVLSAASAPVLIAQSPASSSAAAAQTPEARARLVAEAIPIWPEGVPGLLPGAGPEIEKDARISNVHNPTLTVFLAPEGRRNGTAVIVCPGGGYGRLAIDKEGTVPAQWLNALGASAFVLKYRLGEYGHPAPLRDVLRAVRLVRSQAAKWNVAPDRIGVMGFSAGGHLASIAATLYDAPEGRTGADLDQVSARPDFAVLVYPVISMSPPFVHAGSRENLIGPGPSTALVAHLSTDLQVSRRTPPTFLVHGGTDQSVAPENSVAFYAALRREGVPAELHVYQEGAHGVALEQGHGPISDWPKRCADWLAVRGLLPGK
jgi:acetyl esterase/lipase